MIAKKTLFEIAAAMEGIAILGTLSGSPSARAGVRYGDILLVVNGVRTRTVVDYVEAKGIRADGMDLVIFRAGEEQTLSIMYEAPAAPVDEGAADLLGKLVEMRIFDTPDSPTSKQSS